MELRTLDPSILQPNPANPRHTTAGDDADQQFIANIKAVGIIQPPLVRERERPFEIVAGQRRVRAAIALDFPKSWSCSAAPTMVETRFAQSPKTSFAPISAPSTNGERSSL